MSYDLSQDLVELQPVDYTKGVYSTVQNLSLNLIELADKHNSLDKDTEASVNDLQKQLDNITSLSESEIDDINTKLTSLKQLLGEGDTENEFLDVIDVTNKLVESLNAIKKSDTFTFLFNSDSGEVNVDLSAYSFEDSANYEVLVAMNGGFMAPVTLQVEKVDEKTAKVIARDIRHFAELNVKYTDGSVANESGEYDQAFPFTILVNYDKVMVTELAPREITEN
jgi:hypothetical protein